MIDIDPPRFKLHLYFVKNDIIKFFLTREDIEIIKSKCDFESIQFTELKELIEHEIIDRELELTDDAMRCIESIENITAFYFEQNNKTGKPKNQKKVEQLSSEEKKMERSLTFQEL